MPVDYIKCVLFEPTIALLSMVTLLLTTKIPTKPNIYIKEKTNGVYPKHDINK